jgi:predicted  nucleic acid-binding Zn-ribbon protein
MSDTERIKKLEDELGKVKAELRDLSLAIQQLSSTATRRRESIESAIHGIQNDLEIIYTNVKMPGIQFTPGKRASIA